jgi:multidrug transporter EmrE-like cation transporter
MMNLGKQKLMNEQLAQSWWLILISIASGVAGQTCLKIGLTQAGGNAASDTLFSIVGIILRSPLVMGGLVLYAVGAIAWIAVLRRMDLSYAYPFLALNFVLIVLVGQLVLGETVPWIRWVGIGAICIGILLIANSGVPQ